MGCLRNIINLIILGFAVIGFLSIGGKEYLEEKVMPTINKFKTEITTELDKTDKSFTDMTLNEIKDLLWTSTKATFVSKKKSNGHVVTEIKGLMGYDTKIMEDNSSGQKMVLVDTKNKLLLDLDKTDNIQLKSDLLNLAKKHKATPVKFDDINISETGKWKVLDKETKYIKVDFVDENTKSEITAIISTYEKDGETKMLVTYAPSKKFSKKTAEKYYKKMR